MVLLEPSHRFDSFQVAKEIVTNLKGIEILYTTRECKKKTLEKSKGCSRHLLVRLWWKFVVPLLVVPALLRLER